ISAREDLGASVTGGLFNNIVAFNSLFGIAIQATGFANSHNLIFHNTANSFTPGPGTINADPRFVDRAAANSACRHAHRPSMPAWILLCRPASPWTLPPARVRTIDIGAYESRALTDVYAVKFLCGRFTPASGVDGPVKPGEYQTAISLH